MKTNRKCDLVRKCTIWA